MKKSIIFLTGFLLLMILATSCLPGTNPSQEVVNEFGVNRGFLIGLWHGFIAPFTFIISLFTENINIYEVHNNGGWYDFGFVIGAMIMFSGGGRASGHKRRRN